MSLRRFRRAPDDGAGGGAASPGTNQPPAPAKLSAEELEKKRAELEAQVKALEEKLSKGEQRGISESTAHALLEEFRETKKDLAELKKVQRRRSSLLGF